MKNLKNLFLAFLAIAGLSLTGCIHIIEELTVRNNGSGSYQMTMDMSEVKSMMDMLKGMGEDSTGVDGEEAPVAEDATADEDDSMAQLGQELSNVAKSLRGIPGLSKIQEINDTSTYMFGYSFDYANIAALNKALKVINKEKYESKTEEVFKFKGKNFERLGTGDLGEEIKKALADNEDEEAEDSMEMVKMFFADMTYQQVYHFPDRTVKKTSNALSELSDGDHTLTITIKPFDEEQQAQKVSVATKVKLK